MPPPTQNSSRTTKPPKSSSTIIVVGRPRPTAIKRRRRRRPPPSGRRRNQRGSKDRADDDGPTPRCLPPPSTVVATFAIFVFVITSSRGIRRRPSTVDRPPLRLPRSSTSQWARVWWGSAPSYCALQRSASALLAQYHSVVGRTTYPASRPATARRSRLGHRLRRPAGELARHEYSRPRLFFARFCHSRIKKRGGESRRADCERSQKMLIVICFFAVAEARCRSRPPRPDRSRRRVDCWVG